MLASASESLAAMTRTLIRLSRDERISAMFSLKLSMCTPTVMQLPRRFFR